MDRSQNINFQVNEIKTIKFQFTFRKRIQQGLKQYQYNSNISYEQNIKKFCHVLQNYVALQPDLSRKFMFSFKLFISIQNNIPIQVNFKMLKYQQLISLIQEWQLSLKQPQNILISQRLYTIQHRNILFNRVFVQQKVNIQEYFQTISQKKMLKPVDIYQLLVDILSHYYLYEYATDNGTFFQKINSYNKFLQVVQQFKQSQRRIIIDNKSKDFDYIKLYQFQALINYWQAINPQLQLRSDVRFSISSVSVQTQRHMIFCNKDNQTQTIDETFKKLTLEGIINKTIKDLNIITQSQQDPFKLQIIQNICEDLRKQKIKLYQLQKNNHINQTLKIKNNVQKAFLNSRSQIIQQNQSINVQDDLGSQSQKTQRISIRNSRKNNEDIKQKIFLKRKQDQRLNVYQNNHEANNIDNSFLTEQNYYQAQKKSKQKQNLKSKKSKSKQKNLPYFKKTPQKQKSSQRKNQNQYKSRTYSFKKDLLLQIEDEQSDIYNQNDAKLLSLLQKIYEQYSDQQTSAMNIQKLNQFFIEIGIIQRHQTSFTFELIRRNTIKNLNKITIINFLQLMQEIRRNDPDLTQEVIQEFVDLLIKRKQKIHKKQQRNSLSSQYSFYSFNKSPSKANLNNKNMQQSSQKKKRRYKYSQDSPKIDLNNITRNRERGSIPLHVINQRTVIEKNHRL